MRIITINQVNASGKVTNKVSCSVLKVLKDTPENITFIGFIGLFDISIVRAEKHYEDDRILSYYVRNNWLFQFPDIINFDSDYDS